MGSLGAVTRMKAPVLAATVLTLALTGGAAQGTQPHTTEAAVASRTAATFGCLASFSGGSGRTFYRLCVSSDGTIDKIEGPMGRQHIGKAEGYCFAHGSQPNQTAYYDAGALGQAGWGASVVSQPNGANTLPLTITRKTQDGRFRLRQTFFYNVGGRQVTVTMTLTNVGSASEFETVLVRYFNGDSGPSGTGHLYARTHDSVFAWDDEQVTHNSQALVLINHSLTTPFTGSHVYRYANWSVPGGGASRCIAEPFAATPTAPGDFVGSVLSAESVLTANRSMTLKVAYKLA